MSPSPKPHARELRVELLADGARPRACMSDLFRYMLEPLEQLQALREEAFSSEAIELRRNGRPVSAELAKLTWSRRRLRNVGEKSHASETTVFETKARTSYQDCAAALCDHSKSLSVRGIRAARQGAELESPSISSITAHAEA